MSRRRPSGKLGRWVETVTLFEAIEESGPPRRAALHRWKGRRGIRRVFVAARRRNNVKATLLARTAPSSVRCKDRRISEAATTRHPVCASRRLSEGAKPLFLARIRASEKRRHARNSVRLAMIRAANSTSTYASRPCEMPSSSMMPSSSSIISRLSTWNFGLGAHRHQVGRSSLSSLGEPSLPTTHPLGCFLCNSTSMRIGSLSGK